MTVQTHKQRHSIILTLKQEEIKFIRGEGHQRAKTQLVIT